MENVVEKKLSGTALNLAKQTGIEIVQDGEVTA